MFVQNLKPPYLVVKMVPDFEGLNLAPLQTTFFYGIIEQINYNTFGLAVGDIIYFQLNNPNASFFNNGNQYYIVSEADTFYTAMSTANKIFDYTFDNTFE